MQLKDSKQISRSKSNRTLDTSGSSINSDEHPLNTEKKEGTIVDHTADASKESPKTQRYFGGTSRVG
jgi:hypothetical protein